jgi:hypothetical protein
VSYACPVGVVGSEVAALPDILVEGAASFVQDIAVDVVVDVVAALEAAVGTLFVAVLAPIVAQIVGNMP